MPTTVYMLLCQTDRTGQVLGVFADRAHAADIARCCAATHAEKLRRQDQQTFKAPVAADIYQVHVEDRTQTSPSRSATASLMSRSHSAGWSTGSRSSRIRSEEPAQRGVRPSGAATPMNHPPGPARRRRAVLDDCNRKTD